MITKKDIIDDTNKLLRQKSVDVILPLSEEDAKTLDDMMEYLEASQDEQKAIELDITPGVGLAAPQIGILKNMFCVLAEDEKGNQHKYALVNPKLISNSTGMCYLQGGEGCLSVPTQHQGYVRRFNKIKMQAYDHISKQNVTLVLKGYVSVVVQHEYDHLFGTLFYDHIDKKNPFFAKEEDIII